MTAAARSEVEALVACPKCGATVAGVADCGRSGCPYPAVLTPAAHPMVRPRFLVPLVLFAAMAVVLAIGLTLRPQEIPSALIGKPVPAFALAPVAGIGAGLSSADLKGQVVVINVFASWCVPCRAEHPLWMNLASQQTVPVFGINYKDTAENAATWLASLGNPYQRTGADLNGRAAVDFGVYGVPETFVIDREGRIQFKVIGPVDRHILETQVLPKVRELQGR